ncbi:cell division protein FtsZ, partial [Candidatus Micrarchaeota archaeon]|nr:cell division protein FtsZ [Candidatus Micrarchaeota archaeon]
VDFTGATGVLLHITGGADMTLGECNSIGEKLTEKVDPKATVIWGARLDPSFEGKIEAIAIFTGIRSPYILGKQTFNSGSGSSSGKPSGKSGRGRGEVEDITFL